MRSGLGNVVTVPRLANGCNSVWAQYTIRLPDGAERDGFRRRAEGAGHSDRDLLPEIDASADRLSAITRSPMAACRSASSLSDDVISLPMHAYLDEPTQERIIAAVREHLAN